MLGLALKGEGRLEEANVLADIAPEFGEEVKGRPYLRTAFNKETMVTVQDVIFIFNLVQFYRRNNLAVAHGTLSDEERFKINEHIIQTIILLNQLPFPRELSRVPTWAGNHHEKLDGTGYPRRLTARDLSLPERIMAIADIFEALTAADRPYKKAKTLSESVRIMSFMRNEGHICPDLFKLFLRSGVYLEYARAHLSPAQIDAVDLAQYLGEAPA